MTREDRINQASRLMGESDGTVEDLASLVARHAHYTRQECEERLTLALKLEIDRLLGGAE